MLIELAREAYFLCPFAGCLLALFLGLALVANAGRLRSRPRTGEERVRTERRRQVLSLVVKAPDHLGEAGSSRRCRYPSKSCCPPRDHERAHAVAAQARDTSP